MDPGALGDTERPKKIKTCLVGYPLKQFFFKWPSNTFLNTTGWAKKNRTKKEAASKKDFFFSLKKKNRKIKEAASKKEAGGDPKHILFLFGLITN